MLENFNISDLIFIFTAIIIICVISFIPLKINSNKIFIISAGIIFLLAFSALKGIAHYTAVQNYFSFGWQFSLLVTLILVTVFSAVIIPIGKMTFSTGAIIKKSKPDEKPIIAETIPSKEIVKEVIAEELAEEVNFFPDKTAFGITAEPDIHSEINNEEKPAEVNELNKPAAKKAAAKPGRKKTNTQKAKTSHPKGSHNKRKKK